MFQKGFSAIFVIASIVLTLLVGGFFLLKPKSTFQKKPEVQVNPTVNPAASPQNTDEPPLKLKSIGVNFEDFKFTKAKLQFNRLFMGFGFYIPGGDGTHPAKYNPQPTFIVPLGTPVRSLVDGVVAAVPQVWSGDYSIQVTETGKMEKWVYETEHVKNPLVKVGDRVKAGQIIAEASDFDKGNSGLGAVEIGILKGGNPPRHVCPFAYLDESIKEEILKKITAFFKSWEDYIGDSTLYPETYLVPGCLTLDEIEG